MKTIYFIRHGLSELGAAGKLAGATDTPLVPEGKKQAKKAGCQAKRLGIEHIISSPLSRSLETARIMAKEMGYPADKIEVNPLFRERDFGTLDGLPYRPGVNYDLVPGAEPKQALLDRTKRAVHYLQSLPYSKILVVSHGSTGRALRHHIFPDQPFHAPIKYANAEIVEWALTSGGTNDK